ncbi:hypothetical protein, partial [Burkholderia ambifaria]|uniref:hypothetical protein n=1 Tax=Burkholderia ambifaria TaxID=152480 RepID=UPI001ABBE17C
PIMDTIARDRHGLHHAITIMPDARERGNGRAESLTVFRFRPSKSPPIVAAWPVAAQINPSRVVTCLSISFRLVKTIDVYVPR